MLDGNVVCKKGARLAGLKGRREEVWGGASLCIELPLTCVGDLVQLF